MPFVKGQSGNPGGRPRMRHEVTTLAKDYAKPAFERLVQLLGSSDERVALAAAKEVLDRAYEGHRKP